MSKQLKLVADIPAGLDMEAWERWYAYRKAIKKPIKGPSVEAAMRKLAAFGADQAAVVENSVAEGYQGLFAAKTQPGQKVATVSAARDAKEQADIAALHARRAVCGIPFFPDIAQGQTISEYRRAQDSAIDDHRSKPRSLAIDQAGKAGVMKLGNVSDLFGRMR